MRSVFFNPSEVQSAVHVDVCLCVDDVSDARNTTASRLRAWCPALEDDPPRPSLPPLPACLPPPCRSNQTVVTVFERTPCCAPNRAITCAMKSVRLRRRVMRRARSAILSLTEPICTIDPPPAATSSRNTCAQTNGLFRLVPTIRSQSASVTRSKSVGLMPRCSRGSKSAPASSIFRGLLATGAADHVHVQRQAPRRPMIWLPTSPASAICAR